MPGSPGTPGGPGSWDELLDTLEDRLTLWRGAASGTVPPEALVWPDLGPVPLRLRGRARELLLRYAEVHAAAARRHDLLRALVEEERPHARLVGTPLFVDERA
ncbi:MAG: hypothetical protein ACP5PM_00125 [Acidimicrobiales bacterium]